MTDSKYPVLSIRLSKVERRKIDQAAKAKGQSRGAFVRACINTALAKAAGAQT